MATVIAFLLGVSVGLIIRLTQYENTEEEQRRIINKLDARAEKTRRRAKREHIRRLDAEIDLDDAHEIILYQRDRLYSLTHRAEITEANE